MGLRRRAAIFILLTAAVAASAEPPAVREVRVQGGRQIGAGALRNLLPVRGRPLDEAQLKAAREVALSLLHNRGWLEARVSARAEGLDLVLDVDEGPLYRFGETRFEGLSKLPERALRNELTYEPGDPYERPELLRAQARLFGLGLFEDIDISVSTTSAKTAEVRVKVRERPLKWLKTGVGWGSEERERLSATLTHNNLFRRAYVAEAGVLYSHIWLETRLDFVNRHFFGTDAEQRTSVTWRRENRQGYDLERSQGRFSLSSPFARYWRVTSQYKVSRTVLYNVDPEIAASEPDKPLQSGFSVGLDYDDADDLFFPTRGKRAGVLAERQGGFLGGDVHIQRASGRGAFYANPFWKVVTAVTASGGAVRPFGRSEAVPIFERWFLGGATTVRGFRERGVGPTDALGNPTGGDFFTRGGVEVRAPLYKRLGLAAFLDGGMTSARGDLVWPGRWEWGAGPGLRLRTPIGPVRFDAGWRVRSAPGVSRWVLHFSLGEAF